MNVYLISFFRRYLLLLKISFREMKISIDYNKDLANPRTSSPSHSIASPNRHLALSDCFRHHQGRIIDQSRLVPSAPLKTSLSQEFQLYYETGNCKKGCKLASVNSTLFQRTTVKWFVHYSACPYDGCLPLLLLDLEGKQDKSGFIFEYCRTELKKMLLASMNNFDCLLIEWICGSDRFLLR